MHRHLMTKEEIVAYTHKLEEIGMQNSNPGTLLSPGERHWNPNLSVLMNPGKIEQIDLCPERPTCEVWVSQDAWMSQDAWQVHIDTTWAATTDKKLTLGNVRWKSDKFYGIKIIADVHQRFELFPGFMKFLGKIQLRRGNKNFSCISVWYNFKRSHDAKCFGMDMPGVPKN